MNFFFGYIIFYLIIAIYSKRQWLPEEIKNPLKNPFFCKIKPNRKSLICDPEKLLKEGIKDDLVTDLMINIPQSSPCFCDRECDLYDYKKRLMIGIVAISSINPKIVKNCSDYSDIYECFSGRVLQKWNISFCDGNHGLILLINNQIHLYFGAAIKLRIPKSCIHRLYSTIRPYVPLNFNLKTIFRETIRILRKPCLCSDSCSFRHLKWLTNIVFFMGVIVLVTCIGGMSRRAMLAKFHQRSFSSRYILRDYLVHRRPSVVRPARDHSVDNTANDVCEDIRPPDYSTLSPLPKPPPYLHNENGTSIKTSNTQVPQNVSSPTEGESPPSYEFIIRDQTTSPVTSNDVSSAPQQNHT